LVVDVSREVGWACQYLTAYVCPQFGERGLHALREWSGHANHDVAPFMLIAGITEPMVSHSHAACVTDTSIHDDRAAMIPQMVVIDLADFERPEHTNLPARVAQSFDVCFRTFLAANCIEQHAHGNAGAGAGDQRIEHHVAEFARLPHVSGERDALLRGGEIGEQRVEPLIAVVQELHAATRDQRNTQYCG
jgi:hypothetical protein